MDQIRNVVRAVLALGVVALVVLAAKNSMGKTEVKEATEGLSRALQHQEQEQGSAVEALRADFDTLNERLKQTEEAAQAEGSGAALSSELESQASQMRELQAHVDRVDEAVRHLAEALKGS